ncbi:type III pantothenate kinase [Gilvimarinus agarilyticus]|uniref:type III pantothenate kinase n=1 Tax=Gilvimarinus agarilyticus TaxID=679259 RepID=UPI000695D768|nr:type III pantothenate kinase [Gilvimarinus agarilyticus]
MILQIDIGNTRIKWRLRDQCRTLDRGVSAHGDYPWLAEKNIVRVWVSSVVVAESERLIEALGAAGLPAPEFASAQFCLGDVVSGYQEPHTLGVDRWLALLGARQRVAEAVLVVDAGTALTVDLLASDGRHLGGYIAPGLALMRQSLALKSHALAVDSASCDTALPGRSSAEAIEAGLTAMGRGVIVAGCDSLRKAGSEPTILFTGGDGPHWQRVLGEGEVVPELLFAGLERYFLAQ